MIEKKLDSSVFRPFLTIIVPLYMFFPRLHGLSSHKVCNSIFSIQVSTAVVSDHDIQVPIAFGVPSHEIAQTDLLQIVEYNERCHNLSSTRPTKISLRFEKLRH